MTEVSSLTGRLLVASPALADPNFDRAVVLVLDHDDEGTLGVVLNRPTPVDVHDVLAPWAGLAGVPQVVFQGGPVSLDSALALAVVPGDHRGGGDPGPLGWRRVHGAIGLVDLEAPRSCWPPSWARCGSSPGTRAGGPASWRRKW